MRTGRVASYWMETSHLPAGTRIVCVPGAPLWTVALGDQCAPVTGTSPKIVAVPPLRETRRPALVAQSRVAPGLAPSSSVWRGPMGPVRFHSWNVCVRATGEKLGGGPLAYAARVVMT